MRHVVFLSLLVFVSTCANLSAQNVLPESVGVSNDNLVFEKLPILQSDSDMTFTAGLSDVLYSRSKLSKPLIMPLGVSDYSDLDMLEPSTLSMPSRIIVPRGVPLYHPMTGSYVQNYRSSMIPVNHSGYMPLISKGNHVFGLTGSNNFYPSMGFSNSFSLGHRWAVTDRVSLHGSVYASDNMYRMNRFKNLGVSGGVRIQVADGVFLNGHGSHTVYNSSAAGQIPPYMYPTDYYGGSIEVKITGKFGLQAGAQRWYNAFTRQWDTSYYVLPVFY